MQSTNTCKCPYCGSDYVPPPVQVNLDRNDVVIDGYRVPLTGRLAEMLSILVDAYPSPIDRNRLTARIYGFQEEPDSYKIVNVFAYNLRKRINPYGWTIKSHADKGYTLERTA